MHRVRALPRPRNRLLRGLVALTSTAALTAGVLVVASPTEALAATVQAHPASSAALHSQFSGTVGAAAAAPTPDGKGFWTVTSSGQVSVEGDATFYGDASTLNLNGSIVSIAPTFDGRGYWLLGSDGGVFSYGDASFYGSTGAITLNRPIVGMAAV